MPAVGGVEKHRSRSAPRLPSSRRIEVFTGAAPRRRWSAEAKAQIVAESYETSVGETSARHSVSGVSPHPPSDRPDHRTSAVIAVGGVPAPVTIDHIVRWYLSGDAYAGCVRSISISRRMHSMRFRPAYQHSAVTSSCVA
jgi:hypothetical protein